MHSVSGVMCLDMWTGLIVMVFLTFTSCCLIRYAETRFLGGGGKQWKGGTVWIGTSAVLFRDTAHNWVGWVESLHISCISLGAVVECDGMEASISRAGMGVVLNAPVMNRSALFCVRSRVFSIAEDLPSQNAALPYVAIGRTAPIFCGHL